jgi:hypothetical protein
MAVVAVAAICFAIACRKDNSSANNAKIPPTRKVRFELFTAQDFSDQPERITFSLYMANDDRRIFDSAISPMRVEDIPDSLHRIIIEHEVPGNDTSTLVVGWLYHIDNVGYSWYLDSFPAADSFKLVRYSFR